MTNGIRYTSVENTCKAENVIFLTSKNIVKINPSHGNVKQILLSWMLQIIFFTSSEDIR